MKRATEKQRIRAWEELSQRKDLLKLIAGHTDRTPIVETHAAAARRAIRFILDELKLEEKNQLPGLLMRLRLYASEQLARSVDAARKSPAHDDTRQDPPVLADSAPPREICKICYHVNTVGFRVPDGVWALAVPGSLRNSTICLGCFTRLADERELRWDHDIDLYPVSRRTARSRS